MRLDPDEVRRARERLGYSIELGAQKAGVAKNSLLRAEHGGDIRPSTARKLAAALEVEVSDLLGTPEAPKDEAPSLQQSLDDMLKEERRAEAIRELENRVGHALLLQLSVAEIEELVTGEDGRERLEELREEYAAEDVLDRDSAAYVATMYLYGFLCRLSHKEEARAVLVAAGLEA